MSGDQIDAGKFELLCIDDDDDCKIDRNFGIEECFFFVCVYYRVNHSIF